MSDDQKAKPLASLSLDLDNKWAYLKTAGDPRWESFPSYFDLCVPRILDFFDKFAVKSTVFVVGQDAVLEKNHDAIRSLAEAGHEIANHSFHHEPWLHLYTRAQLEKEFSDTEQSIEKLTGEKPIGFRGPGFSLSDEVLRTLMRRGYVYDCSTFPTYLGPIARLYYFFKSSLSQAEKEDRKELFGKARDGFQTNDVYEWNWRGRRLIELPVTTMPLMKSPIHGSLFLDCFETLQIDANRALLVAAPVGFHGTRRRRRSRVFPSNGPTGSKEDRFAMRLHGDAGAQLRSGQHQRTCRTCRRVLVAGSVHQQSYRRCL